MKKKNITKKNIDRRSDHHPLVIRNAKPADLNGVWTCFLDMGRSEDHALSQTASSFLKTRRRRKDFTSSGKRELLSQFRQPGSVYLIAELNGTIVGYARASVQHRLDPFFIRTPVGTLEAIVVRPPYRGRGIARELHQEIKRWFRMNHINHIRLDVIAKNPAVNLYKKWGYKITVHTMTKKL